MNLLLEQNNYVVIDNFLIPQQAKELYLVFKNDVLTNNVGEIDNQCPNNAKSVFNYRWFSEIHVNKLYQLSEFMGESLFPTYQYSRLYQKGSFLEKHTDRPACEISVTVHLGSDGTPWPLYFTKPNGDVNEINLSPGQAAIYLGTKSIHWRNAYQGTNYAQVFLHYVTSRGPNWQEMFDLKRINSKNE